MSLPPDYYLHDFGPKRQMMLKLTENQRLSVILQYIAIGSTIITAGFAASHVLREIFRSTGQRRDRGPKT